ncbi:hypothetical protein KI387_021840 [Taxus chinensis]|uniref:Flavanone 4-reductase n=1 Tax=Taxus chinensis TaxID=29808 RepID=A0AA38GAV1_TAXCH|nr:hypothetical protein KI387_021840 [Taxus chinensis]
MGFEDETSSVVMSEAATKIPTQKEERGTVCVTGAAGFIGSWLIMRLLERGYTVRATVRDPGNPVKTKHLLDLPEASERLTLWKADLDDEGSFDAAFDGCEGVFHVATAMDFDSKDPENEIIKPCVAGVLNVMRSCAKAKSVKRVIFTSSAGTVNFTDDCQTPGKIFDEECWTNVDRCRSSKMTGWTLAERAAWEFAEQNKVDLISVIPTLVVGPFIMQTMPPSLITALALLTKNEPHYMILRQVQLVHLDDLCMSLIFLFKDADESLQPVAFSNKKLVDLGFKFKYTPEDMFDGAIQCCLEKGLLK